VFLSFLCSTGFCVAVAIVVLLGLSNEAYLALRGPFNRFERRRSADLAKARYLTRLPARQRYDLPAERRERVRPIP
jgi:hypothetical protein